MVVNNPRVRDQSLERLLRQSLKTPSGGATTSCLDPETLAAWADGGLSGHELEVAQSHAADCARCQSALAALVRTSLDPVKPVAETLDQGHRRWFAWLVPLTAAAAAIAIWVAVPRGPAIEHPRVAEIQSAQPKPQD